MTLRPTDMLEIQSAIDEYERKYPRRPAPSAEVALAWRLGKREAARILGSNREPSPEAKPEPEFAGQECSRLTWAWERVKLRWDFWNAPKDETHALPEPMQPLVRGVLLVGGWSVFAVVVASLFFFGAVVGGFK